MDRIEKIEPELLIRRHSTHELDGLRRLRRARGRVLSRRGRGRRRRRGRGRRRRSGNGGGGLGAGAGGRLGERVVEAERDPKYKSSPREEDTQGGLLVVGCPGYANA